MSAKPLKLAIVLASLSLVASACSMPSALPNPFSKPKTASAPVSANSPSVKSSGSTQANVTQVTYTDKLKQFNNYAAVAGFLSKQSYFYNNKAVTSNSSAANDFIAPIPSHSSVNLENRIIQTDGSYVYALDKSRLVISQLNNGQLSLVSQAVFKSRPSGLSLFGHFLAVYGEDTNIQNESAYKQFKRQDGFSFLTVFDVSDPSHPKQTRNLELEGHYLELSAQGNYLYILTKTPGEYGPGYPVIPGVLENGQVLSNDCSASSACFAPAVYYFDTPYTSYSFISLLAVDISDNTQAISGQVYISPTGQFFRLGPSTLDIAYSQPVNSQALTEKSEKELIYPQLGTSTRQQVDAINRVADSILSPYDKNFKIAQVLDSYLLSLPVSEQSAWKVKIASSTKSAVQSALKKNNYSSIYQFALQGDKFSYQAFGQVPGRLLSGQSWDKSGDYLRLVTVSDPAALGLPDLNNSYYNNVYVLGPNLKRVGSLENLTTTHSLSSAYFLGDRLYLVSSDASDPLFVISLNDPSHPSVSGAVQIPGQDNYLQALDANGLKLAVISGQGKVNYKDGSSGQGLTCSLLDLSNLKQPKELSSYLVGPTGSKTIALEDHNALNYLPEKNLLLLPASLTNNGIMDFSGVIALSFSGDSIKLLGKVDHSAGGHFKETDNWQGIEYYNNTVKASLPMGSNLLTLSNKFLKLNNLSDLSSVSSLELTTAGDDYMMSSSNAKTASSTDSLASSTPGMTASSTVNISASSSPAIPPQTNISATTTASSTPPTP